MRQVADRERIGRLIEALGRAAEHEVRVFLVGGTTAVLMGWRATTADVDFVMRPEDDAVFRTIPALKEALQVNIEMASPADFIPVPAGWEERGVYVSTVGRATFYHFDLYAQALAKVERGHPHDLADVRAMLDRRLIEAGEAMAYFDRMEPALYRFPAIDPPSYRRAVNLMFGESDQ